MFGQDAPLVLPKDLRRLYEADLWSTLRYANAAALADSDQRLYTTPISGTGQGFGVPLSISETNVLEAGRIPTGQAFTVYAVAAEPRYDDNACVVRADLANLQYFSSLHWNFLNTVIPIGPLGVIGQGGGISGSTADTGGVEGGAGGSRIVLNSGFGQVWTYDTMAILLPASTTFSISHRWGTGAAAVDGGPTTADLYVRVHLFGSTVTAIPVA